MKSTIFSLAAVAGLASASPIKRADGPSDAVILNYALTLEHLEDTFYREALQQFSASDFTAAGFSEDNYNKIQTVASDEASHVSFLSGALRAAGATPVEACTYDFGYENVAGFMATAAVLEGVGVSAYLGAAADIMSKTFLTAAGSILTVEARHAAYVRDAVKQEPFPQPFDNPLGYNSVFTLAAQFITSCPESNPALPVKAFPTLTVAAVDEIRTGSTITLGTQDYKIEGQVYAAFITVTGPIFVDASAVDGGFQVVIPEGVKGQSYVVLTSCNTAATDDTIVAGPAILEIPA